MRRLGLVLAVIGLLGAAAFALATPRRPAADGRLSQMLRGLSRDTEWNLVSRAPLDFDAFHPQGLARVGNRLFLSSVEIIEATEECDPECGGYDRTPGRGVGHLFVLDLNGDLLDEIELGEGHMYHPGGIDFDGRWMWVPVAQYRPDSRSIVYRVDPRTLSVSEAFRVRDHIGGVVRDRETRRLFGVSWGSRRYYEWGARGRLLHRSLNPSHFIDYQDCQYIATGRMGCGGIAEYDTASGDVFELGGIALIDLRDQEILHEVPLTELSPGGHVVTRNPVLLESSTEGVRLYAVPDDDEAATLLIYESS
jgi:hypothetical protein